MLYGDDFAWHDHAACRTADDALFFPERGGSTAAAFGFCRICPLAAFLPCLREGINLKGHDDLGVWGGTTVHRRRLIRRRLRAGTRMDEIIEEVKRDLGRLP